MDKLSIDEEYRNEIKEIDSWVDSYNDTILNDPMMSKDDKEFFLRLNEHDRWKGRENARERYKKAQDNKGLKHHNADSYWEDMQHEEVEIQQPQGLVGRALSWCGGYLIFKKIMSVLWK